MGPLLYLCLWKSRVQPQCLWDNEAIACLWRVSHGRAVLSSYFEDLSGIKNILYFLYLVFCLHKANEGLGLAPCLTWVSPQFSLQGLNEETCSGSSVLVSGWSAGQASQCHLPDCIGPPPPLLFSTHTSYSTYAHRSGVLLTHMGLLWRSTLCKTVVPSDVRVTRTKEITKSN